LTTNSQFACDHATQLIAIVDHQGNHGTDVKLTATRAVATFCGSINMAEYSSLIVSSAARLAAPLPEALYTTGVGHVS
jgi:hypothetical protein